MHPPQTTIFQPLQLHLPPNQPTPPCSTQLPSHTITNPNNRDHPALNVGIQTFPTYMISPLPLHDIHLRCDEVLDKTEPVVIIEEEHD